MEFYQCEKVAANVTKIGDLTGVYAYLIEGREKAALIDTCSGIGNLKETIQNLTQLPVIVICTHGHIDHAGGTYGFETVFLNEKDYELVRMHTSLEFRKGSLESGRNPHGISPEDLVPQREGDYQKLSDGQEFSLGGTTLRAIELPGHTQGMTCILIREMRVVILGDGCNPFTFLFLPESSSVERYRTALQVFLAHEDEYDTVWLSHGPYRVPKSIVNDNIELCGDIMAGKVDKIPFDFHGRTALIAKAMNPDRSRVDGKVGNIVYNPERVFGV